MADSTVVETALLRIDELRRLGLPDAADAASRELLQVAPDEPKAWLAWGTSALARGSPTEAESAFRQAVALEPRNAAAASYLSVALLHQGQAKEAETYARQAVALDDSNSHFWGNLGACQ